MRTGTNKDSLDKIIEESLGKSREIKLAKAVSSFLYSIAVLNSLIYITTLATALHYGRLPGHHFTDFILLYTAALSFGLGKALSNNAEDLRYKSLAKLILKYK